jgi:hypothetical protein
MKTPYYLIILFSVLFSFNALSQNKLKINHIAENQEVSGNLVVKLDTMAIKDYRFVSYYIDDKFLSTIYDSPFTIQFDTRDFENGKHQLFAKAFREDGIIDITKVEIKVSNIKPAFNLIVNNVRRFASAEQVPIGGSYIDAPHSILKKNDKEFYIQHSKGLLRHPRRLKEGMTSR